MIDLETIKNQIILHNLEFTMDEEYHAKIVAICKEFQGKMDEKGQSNDFYEKNREAVNASGNNFCGKYSEFQEEYGLRHFLGFPRVPIDVEIRKGSKKRWETDLSYALVDKRYPNGHCKGCNEDTKGSVADYSWTFQLHNKNGPGGTDRLFKWYLDWNGKPTNDYLDDLIIMGRYEYVPTRKFVLVATAPWRKLRLLLRDPVREEYKGLKRCIYYEDICRSCY